MSLSAIKTENLTHIYSENTPFEKKAIENVNIEIEKGEIVGIIGHTGSGKSTLIQHFNGLLKPTSGKILINDVDIWQSSVNIRDIRFKVGLVFQYPEYQLFEETVFKDIAFGPKNMGLSDSEIKERVYEAANFVGLNEEVLSKSPFELSGGQKRRVAIAGVIAMRPEILILDEPTAGLDPRGREMILNQIGEYHKSTGGTVLIVSHSMEDIARFTNKALVLKNSGIFMYDTIDNVFSHSQELTQIGLNIPQITKVFIGLRAKGFDVDSNIYTVENAKNEILSKLLKRRTLK